MTTRLPLYNGEIALIDDADLALVEPYRWLADKRRHTTYAWAHIRNADGTWSNLKLHRLILGAPKGVKVDHQNHNGLDNRRSNLRLATSGQNNANASRRRDNTSGFKGVTRPAANPKWVAQIRLDRRMTYLGSFETPEEAARAYDVAALAQWGEFAHLNFPTNTNRSKNYGRKAQA
jgi:hypothetical protein